MIWEREQLITRRSNHRLARPETIWQDDDGCGYNLVDRQRCCGKDEAVETTGAAQPVPTREALD